MSAAVLKTALKEAAPDLGRMPRRLMGARREKIYRKGAAAFASNIPSSLLQGIRHDRNARSLHP